MLAFNQTRISFAYGHYNALKPLFTRTAQVTACFAWLPALSHCLSVKCSEQINEFRKDLLYEATPYVDHVPTTEEVTQVLKDKTCDVLRSGAFNHLVSSLEGTF